MYRNANFPVVNILKYISLHQISFFHIFICHIGYLNFINYCFLSSLYECRLIFHILSVQKLILITILIHHHENFLKAKLQCLEILPKCI